MVTDPRAMSIEILTFLREENGEALRSGRIIGQIPRSCRKVSGPSRCGWKRQTPSARLRYWKFILWTNAGVAIWSACGCQA